MLDHAGAPEKRAGDGCVQARRNHAGDSRKPSTARPASCRILGPRPYGEILIHTCDRYRLSRRRRQPGGAQKPRSSHRRCQRRSIGDARRRHWRRQIPAIATLVRFDFRPFDSSRAPLASRPAAARVCPAQLSGKLASLKFSSDGPNSDSFCGPFASPVSPRC